MEASKIKENNDIYNYKEITEKLNKQKSTIFNKNIKLQENLNIQNLEYLYKREFYSKRILRSFLESHRLLQHIF